MKIKINFTAREKEIIKFLSKDYCDLDKSEVMSNNKVGTYKFDGNDEVDIDLRDEFVLCIVELFITSSKALIPIFRNIFILYQNYFENRLANDRKIKE